MSFNVSSYLIGGGAVLTAIFLEAAMDSPSNTEMNISKDISACEQYAAVAEKLNSAIIENGETVRVTVNVENGETCEFQHIPPASVRAEP